METQALSKLLPFLLPEVAHIFDLEIWASMHLLRECFDPLEGLSVFKPLLTRIYVIRCVQSRSHIASFLGREGTRAPGLIDTVLLHLEQLSAAADLGTDWILASEVIQQIDWFISIDVKNIQEQ